MAELAASLVVGPLLSLVKEKVCNSLLDQYKVMEGMEKHHEILKLKLPAILDVIADAEKQASRRGGVKAWLEELKKVAYVANDVFDEFGYEALRRRAKKDGHITKLGMAGVKLFPTHNRVAFHIRMGNKLSRLVESIKVLVEQMKDFGFDKLQLEAAPAWREWRETASNMDDDPKNIVSRSRGKEREKIIEVLLNHQASSSGDLLVIPIVGMGGLGKTTLAQLIYNDPRVQDHFQLLKWVCVSDDFNVRDLANKICNSSETTLEEALKKLQQHLRGKRYLLVLDDVWNKDVDKWGKLKACLKQGGVGSAILTTTRDKQIAGFMGTVSINNSWKRRYHDVAILDKEFIQEIIETRAFNKTKPEELVKLVASIAERCVGSPLAAKALGSVLCNKTTKEEWEDILHRSRICDDETQILRILKLSYNCLPTDMKQCFAFCAMYPKDYQINVDELIQLWMANGYISDQNRVPAETMGKRIVSEMVSRSFFQFEEPRWTGYSRSTSFVKIHDLMHDVASSASEKECVCITDEYIDSGKLLPSVARHIRFQTRTVKKELNFVSGTTRERFPPIQTMIFDRFYEYDQHVPHSSKFGSLRALSPPRKAPNFSIKPKHLCHLRYLDLSHGYDIEALPDDISILYSLQTLKLSGCDRLKRLPEQMKYMTALRHLYTDRCRQLECMPPELGRITSLRTITWFVVGSGLNCCSSLEELKDLSIGGSLMLKQLENVTGRRNAKAANLENKKELRQLSLEWTSGREEEQQCHEVLESLKAHDGLLDLGIYSYQGTNFPSWMGTLKNMVELRLSDCSKVEQVPELLEQLVELKLLHLEGLGKLQFLCSSCTSSTFGKLKDLKLVNLDVFYGFCEVMHGGVVAFPQLEILHIKGCENLAALPEASVLREPYGDADCTVARSAFPKLNELRLEDLYSFERWEAALEIEEEDALLFPSLEIAFISKCPQLTTLPRAPKLIALDWSGGNGQISIGGIGYMMSLCRLRLEGVKLDDKEEWDHPSSVVRMELFNCSLFFQPRAALALWVCYGQLRDLRIDRSNELVYWPEEVFQSLISLRRLSIWHCKNLIGYASENGPDQATSSGRCQLLPHLESLQIVGCGSLVCCKIESLCGKQQLNHEASSTNDMTASTPAEEEKLSPSAAPDNLLPSSLEILTIWDCDGLLEVVNLPSSLREIDIYSCSKLQFVSSSRQLDALQNLTISECPELRSLESLCIIDLSALEYLILEDCISLASFPSAPEPQEYSSLRQLTIKKCPGIKLLPSALQQRLNSGLVDDTNLDSRHEGPGGLG